MGETLTAVTSGIMEADGLASPAYTYQWIRVETDSTETDISGATSSTYTLVAADLGTTIKVKVSFTDDASNPETLTSAATVTVAAAPNTPATGAPTITGTARVDETLTAVTSGTSDADGLTSPTYAYQWIRVISSVDADIAGATSSAYTLVVADEGTTIKVTVSFTDDASNSETLTSAATATVAAAPNTPATGAPTITGTAQVDETLTAVTSGIMDADWLFNPTYTYQWIRVDSGTDADISGATSSTYTLVAADEGTTIKVKVSFTDDASNPETLTSAATATVAAAPNTPATGAPTITGTAQVDETLTAVTTGIMDADGLTSPSYTYQWIRVDSGTDADIAGATSSTYTLVDHDEATTIKVKVSFTDDASNAETRTSVATGTVAAAANNPATGVPTITGTAQVGETLTAVTTGIMDADGLASPSYTYQWIRVDSGTDADIAGATSSTYTLVDPDEATTLKVRVSFEDDDGNPEMRTSAATATVVAATATNNPATGAPTITGTARVDETLTAVTTGIMDADGLTSPTYAYQWIRVISSVDADIAGATSSTYTLVAANEGATIKVRVTFEDDASNAETLTSAATATVVAKNTPATGAPTITGTARVGETLTAATTGIMDADGLASPTYAYQWIRENGTDADISGATSSAYTLVVADEGTTIKVKVSFTDDDGNSETLTSAATATVAAATTPTISAVAVTSTPQLATDTYGEGEEIQFTVTFSEAVTVTGMPQFVFSLGNAGDTRRVNAGYDAAASTDTELVFAYTVVATDEDDNGIFILDDATVRGMSGSGSIVLGMGGSIVGKTSAVPASVAHSVRAAQSGHKVDGSPNSPATGAPTITGTARVGETLTAVTSGITDADGLTSPTYTYQWIRVETDSSETDISGATSSTYTLVDADLGTTIKMRATFDDDAGNSETRTSAATATVAAANSPATGAPTITGTARVDETLTAVTSGIMDADGLASPTYTYQWIRVNGTDADISGATSSTYTLVVADEGKTIKVKVTFDDDAGNTETRTSAATATVAAANTPATGAPTITGTARVGETLTAVTSGIMDADGLASPTYTYQWIRVDTDSTETDISGATSSTYTLVVADLGTTIKMRATFEDDAGNSETRTSVATATVVAANTPATGAPTITGTARVDETLTAAPPASWTPTGWPAPPTPTSGSGWTAARMPIFRVRHRAPTRWSPPTRARRSR